MMSRSSTRSSKRTLGALTACALTLVACSSESVELPDRTDTTQGPSDTVGDASNASTIPPDETEPSERTTAPTTPLDPEIAALHQECLAEGGKVNLIALSDQRDNYEGILDSFGEKYADVEFPVANPDATPAEQMYTVISMKGLDSMPDNVDVNPAVAQDMVDAGLFEPYVLTTDADIPEGLKDPGNRWVAAYYEVTAITTNINIIGTAPATFADLGKPEYQGRVFLNGDPRTSGAALAAVMAASLANGGTLDDVLPGIQYFAALKESGNLGGTEVTKDLFVAGSTPIAVGWSPTVLGRSADLDEAGVRIAVHIPSDGLYGRYFSQGVVAGGPHPSCSKLWMEHLFSNEGALGYLDGGVVPARIAALAEGGLITAEAQENLPPVDLLDQVAFPTPAQVDAAKDVLVAFWGPLVADA